MVGYGHNKVRHGSWHPGAYASVKGTESKQMYEQIRELQIAISSRKEMNLVMALDRVLVDNFTEEELFGLNLTDKEGAHVPRRKR